MSDGCSTCQSEILELKPRLESRGAFASAFQRAGSYQYCTLYRCAECGAEWADFYLEWDDEETMFKEWGHVERASVLLTQPQLEQILAARDTHQLDMRMFMRGEASDGDRG
jgi:DNA-directed RNA polymerase subunit RPC12/RpoP